MSRAPKILDESRCYPLDCRVTHHRVSCDRPDELLYIGWTRILRSARDLQYWAFLPEPHTRWLTDFFQSLDRCGFADEADPGCSWRADEATASLSALCALATDPPLELRELFEIWDGPLSIEPELLSLLDACRAHASCGATLTIRKWWHW